MFLLTILLYSVITRPLVAQPFPSSTPLTSAEYGTIEATGILGSDLENATASLTSTSSLFAITGAASKSISNITSASSTQPQATNTRPCNGYVEFCNRRLSNISMVVAHNSPFVVPHNIASNQDLTVLTQLNDGIRGLQFETHMPNATAGLRLCHTSCDLLDAGLLETYLQTVQSWLAQNPYEVVAIMMGNDDRIAPTNYIQPFSNAGLLPYLYEPPSAAMSLTAWPTLSEMILKNKRVIVMLDYLANQAEVPWLLNQFAYQWQTPFSPTDPAFPCTEQRPPGQSDDVSRDMMYMLNHNLNVNVSISSVFPDLLIPAYTLLDEVNAVSGNGSLGLNVQGCEAMWGRAPNWLLVDYYNYGNFNGSVFQVAATANNVSYNRDSCCGSRVTSTATRYFINFRLRLYVIALFLSWVVS